MKAGAGRRGQREMHTSQAHARFGRLRLQADAQGATLFRRIALPLYLSGREVSEGLICL